MPSSMRPKLFISLFIFVLIALLLLWGLQLFLMNTIYYQLLCSRMTTAATQIESLYADNDESFASDMYAIAINNDFCIHVFGPDGKAVASADIGGGCMLHNVDDALLNDLYNKSLENGGEYFHKAKLRELTKKGEHPIFPNGQYDVRNRVIYVSVKNTDRGQLILMLDAAIEPTSALKSAVTSQLLLTTLIMTLAAAAVANVLAKKLSRPIADVNRAAKRLVAGEYDVTFTGESYKEIHELSATLNQTAEELKRTEKIQKELIANISHDLRTPLTLITGYCEMMRDIEGENTPENMQVVLDETARLSSLVNDLVELSKYQGNSQSLNIESVDVDALLLETVERYRKLMADKGYTFVYESIGSTYAQCDKKRILQVVYNLINNAVNYSGDDKTVIIELSVTKDGKTLIEITDHGEGIAKEDLPLIFDRYYKVDKVHKRAVTGTGLGLSIVKSILESHGASYGVRSEIGTGSTFFFEI